MDPQAPPPKPNPRSQQDELSKTKMKQQRILLLRHASKCPFGSTEDGGNGQICPTAPNCPSMKRLWKHIVSCTEANNRCTYPHCNSSKYVMSHYRSCNDPNCACCQPVRLIIQRQSSSSSTAVASAAASAAATATSVSLSSSSDNKKKHQTQQEPLLGNVNEFPPMPDPTPLSELLMKRKLQSIPKETAASPPNTTVNTNFLSAKGANPNTTNIDDNIASKKRRIQDMADPLLKGTVIEQGSSPYSDDLRQKCVQLCATYSFTDVTSCLQDLYQRMVANNLISTTTTSSSPHIAQATTPAFTTTLVHLCEPLLHQLQESHSQYSWVFMAPVDPVALGLQDYFLIITKPMDLGTVKQKLHSGIYSSIDQFASDVKLVFDNAMTYNPLGTDVHKWANDMKQTFVQHYHNLLTRLLVPTPTTSTIGSFKDI
jgi:hypothetical protein